MIPFIAGAFVGALIGALLMACFVAGADADRRMENG